MFWVAGFDILYACLDKEFDRLHHLHSIPRFFGIKKAFRIAMAFHFMALLFFIQTGISAGTGWIYFSDVAVVFVLLFLEHAAISPRDLSRLNFSFFTVNGMISILLCLATLLDIVKR